MLCLGRLADRPAALFTGVNESLRFTLLFSHVPLRFVMATVSLCQRLDSRQLTKKRAPEVRGKSSVKREYERRRRKSPPEAKGECSEPFAGGARAKLL